MACAVQHGRGQIWWGVWRCLDPHGQGALLEYSLSLLGEAKRGAVSWRHLEVGNGRETLTAVRGRRERLYAAD